MINLIIYLMVFALGLLLPVSSNALVQITGVKGKLLVNIRQRLVEIAQTKPIAQETDDALIAQVAKALEPYGYFKSTIHINARYKENISLTVQPGPVLLITQLDVKIIGIGHASKKINQTLANLDLKQGTAFNSATYEKAKQALENVAARQGYLHTSFDTATVLIDKKNYTAIITLVLNTGPQYFFGRVKFDPTYISPALLDRYLPFHYGHHYSADKVMTFNNYLTSSGYFKSVAVKPQLDSDQRIVPIDVHLQPIARFNYSLGIGYGTDTGPRGRAGIHIVPVNRLGHKFNAIILSSFKENALQTQYVIPGKNPVIDQYEINSSLSNLDYDAGRSNFGLLSLVSRHSLNDFQQILSLNVLDEHYRYDYQPNQHSLAIYPKASLTWLSKSEQLFSPNGYKLTLTGLIANKLVLSKHNFSQLAIDAKAAIKLEQLRTRFYFHTMNAITQIDRIDNLPLSLALLLGGSDNLKGYSYASIGPGKLLSYAGIEIQQETKKNWYGIVFFDTGNTFETNYRPKISQLKHDLGLGLMWVSPVGPIKIGVAQAINNRFQRTSRFPKLVINIGPDL